MRSYLDFEKPVAELEAKVEELRAMGESGDAVAVSEEISRLEAKAALALKDLYAELTPRQKTQVARHPQRPHCVDYINGLITSFIPFAGDRKFGEDSAIVAGFGRLVAGHDAGRSTDSASAGVGGNRTGRAGIARDIAGTIFRYRESLSSPVPAEQIDRR